MVSVYYIINDSINLSNTTKNISRYVVYTSIYTPVLKYDQLIYVQITSFLREGKASLKTN